MTQQRSIADVLRLIVVSDEVAAARRASRDQINPVELGTHLIQTCGCPVRHVHALDNLRPLSPHHPWSEKLTTVTQRIGKGMLICLTGHNGPGKTQIAVCAAQAAAQAHRSVVFVTATRLLAEVKATYRHDAKESELVVLERYNRPSLLIIDELGKRGGTEWEDRVMFELINGRYNALRDTLITANLTLQEAAASLGPGIASRMRECGGLILCDWESFR